MNLSHHTVSLLLVSLAGFAGIGAAPAAKIPDQTIELKVVEVLAASDEYASTRAYVMNWKGQEIAVAAHPLGQTYDAGDTVKIRVQHRPSSLGRKGLLEFRPVAAPATAVQSDSGDRISLARFQQLNSNHPINLRVLQVFSAQEGESVFRAYRANWGGLEVVVWDPLARSKYQTGDFMKVRVNRLPPPGIKGAPLQLRFSVAGPDSATEPDTGRPLLSEDPIGSMGPLP